MTKSQFGRLGRLAIAAGCLACMMAMPVAAIENPTGTPTETPSATETPTPTQSETPTPSDTPTSSPTVSGTPTVTPTPVSTPLGAPPTLIMMVASLAGVGLYQLRGRIRRN